MSVNKPKPVEWIGSSYKGFKAFPGDVQDYMGYALHLVKIGEEHEDTNLFADLGYADAETHLLKAGLVTKIRHIISANNLTQTDAAARIGHS